MIEILSEMRNNGFVVDHLVLDGKIHRFGDKKKSNWYIGFQNHTRGGEHFTVVQYGSWKSGEILTYQSNVEMTGDDRAFVKKKIEEAKKKAEEEKKRVQLEVAEACARYWEKLGDSEITSYMQRKQIRDLFGARTLDGICYVPMRDIDGKLWGLQKIQGDGGKFFSPGQRVAGCFHAIGDLEGADTVYLAEGFATGCSIYSAIERATVVAFNASNLGSVADELAKKYQDKKIIVCADNDLWTTNSKGEPWNPGFEKAQEIAKKIGATVVVPEFKNLDSKPTDFNDLFVLEGAEAVRNQIAPVKAQRHFVAALGFREKDYYFTSTSNQQIVAIKSFSDVEFLNLMPREYWETNYPSVRGAIDWMRAKSELMAACRAKGIFEQKNVRGSGVWMDDGRVVVNQGDHLLVNGSRVELYEIKSRYFYTLGKPLKEISALPLEDCELILNITETFKWQKKEFGRLMAGLLVISKACGALPIRPHVWLTGGSQTGKSTLLERLIFPTLKGYSRYFLGGTSEAGLRQSLGSDSIPVIFDEFETNGPKSAEMIQACVELMRSAWSETHGVIAKGTSGGNAAVYHPRFAAIVSSIRPNLVNDADRSRFTMMELASHGSDLEHWRYLKKLLDLYDDAYIERLFARTLKMLPTILQNYETFRAALSQKIGARFGQQYGMLLAGWAILKFNAPLTVAQALSVVEEMNLDEESTEAKLTDELELVSYLATKKIRSGSEEITVSAALQQAKHPISGPGYQAALETHGLKFGDEHVIVANNHTELRNLLRGTKWEACWPKTLSRLAGAERARNLRFAGKKLDCIKIPANLFS